MSAKIEKMRRAVDYEATGGKLPEHVKTALRGRYERAVNEMYAERVTAYELTLSREKRYGQR